MTRSWIAAAALSGLIAVVADAAARHVFGGDAARADLVTTAARYGLLHGAALLALAAHRRQAGGFWLGAAGWCFVAGMALFCGSLYLAGLGAPSWVLVATPAGGTVLILGWAALLVHAVLPGRGSV
jgi:uncharacterized membrane protein YgdD (TMEM256/DUF423 family)